jgi:hypothetical protein
VTQAPPDDFHLPTDLPLLPPINSGPTLVQESGIPSSGTLEVAPATGGGTVQLTPPPQTGNGGETGTPVVKQFDAAVGQDDSRAAPDRVSSTYAGDGNQRDDSSARIEPKTGPNSAGPALPVAAGAAHNNLGTHTLITEANYVGPARLDDSKATAPQVIFVNLMDARVIAVLAMTLGAWNCRKGRRAAAMGKVDGIEMEE